MRSIIHSLGVVVALAGPVLSVGVGCTANIKDNVINVDDPQVSFDTSVDVDNVEQGQSVPVTINVEEDAILVAPESTPSADQMDAAVYVSIHLDDADSAPLVVTAQASVSVTIPPSTPPGDHELICRVHKHKDGSVGSEETISIKVKASASASSG